MNVDITTHKNVLLPQSLLDEGAAGAEGLDGVAGTDGAAGVEGCDGAAGLEGFTGTAGVEDGELG
jgi:hypothetical protein